MLLVKYLEGGGDRYICPVQIFEMFGGCLNIEFHAFGEIFGGGVGTYMSQVQNFKCLEGGV